MSAERERRLLLVTGMRWRGVHHDCTDIMSNTADLVFEEEVSCLLR